MRSSFHPVTWLLWLAAALSFALLTRNPFYLCLLLLVVGIVYLAQEGPAPLARAWSVFIRAGLFLVLFSILANALTVHAGNAVLFRLPEKWPVVGGPITLEAVLFGLSGGLSLLSLLLIFAVFNKAVSPGALLCLVPGALHQAGIAVTIAIAFVPQMVASAQTIREAQQVRGHRLRGVRDVLPLLVPLLAGGLERSIQLAESLEARGFVSNSPHRQTRQMLAARAVILCSLFGLAVGAFIRAYYPAWPMVGQGMLLLSVGTLLLALHRLGQQARRTAYSRWLWRRHDTIVAAASSLVLAVVLALGLTAREVLVYYPYPPSTLWPSFQPVLAAVLVLLVAPGLMARPTRFAPSVQPVQEVYRGSVQQVVQNVRRQSGGTAGGVRRVPPAGSGT